MIKEISVSSTERNELINITERIQGVVSESRVKEGICHLYVPHTTAAITVNEGADLAVQEDILDRLSDLVPEEAAYHHAEGNADAHIKSTLVGTSLTLLIKNAKLILGTWQSIFFCEFDGPRERRVMIRLTQ